MSKIPSDYEVQPWGKDGWKTCEGCGRNLPAREYWPISPNGPKPRHFRETHCRTCAAKRPRESTRVDILFHESPARRITLRKRVEQKGRGANGSGDDAATVGRED